MIHEEENPVIINLRNQFLTSIFHKFPQLDRTEIF